LRLRILPASATRDASRLIAARALRAFADGYMSVLFPAYLLHLGFSPLDIGVLATATLFGSAGLTLAVGFAGARFGRRRLLLAASALMAATGIGLVSFEAFWPLLVVAFVGTVNPSSGDVSVFLPLEQAALPGTASETDRTALFARYSLAGALAGAFGALAAALPEGIGAGLGWPFAGAAKAMFAVYALLGAAAALLYGRLRLEDAGAAAPAPALGPSRPRVLKLAALFSLDAFAGGFIVQSLLALWLFQAFGLSLADAATIFFWTSLLTAASYLAAAPLARRFGLVNTMVFTHLPSSLCLVLIPFAPELWLAILLLLVRSLLSQMDVPTRTSYVMAVVRPEERPAAASLTSVPRSLAAAASPALAGYLLGLTPFGWPLLVAGAIKIGYDLLLLGSFRHVRPPEEAGRR
jgi:MFS family permease